MQSKHWKTVNEDNMRQQVAAWHWLETIARKQHGNCTVDGALLSDLMLRNFLVKSPEAYTHTHFRFFCVRLNMKSFPKAVFRNNYQLSMFVGFVC